MIDQESIMTQMLSMREFQIESEVIHDMDVSSLATNLLCQTIQRIWQVEQMNFPFTQGIIKTFVDRIQVL